MDFSNNQSENQALPCFVAERTSQMSHTKHMILESDFCEWVVCLGGVVLPKVSTNQPSQVSETFIVILFCSTFIHILVT